MRHRPALLALLCCLAVPGTAAADVIPVAPGGSVQAAVDAAAPGDTVQLTAGAYQGPVVITKDLTLAGPPEAVLSADPAESNVVEVQSSGATLQGFTVDASGVGIGVLGRNSLMESHTLTVRDLVISGHLDAGLVARFGGLALDAEGIVVQGSPAPAPGQQRGIVVERGAVATIRDATVTAHCGTACAGGLEDPLSASPAGVLVRDASSATVIGSVLSGNRVGVRAAGAARVDVLDTRLRDNGTGVQVLDVEGAGDPAATRGVVHGSEITGGTRGVLVRDATPGDGLRPAPQLRADRIVGQSGTGVDADVPVQATDVWWGCNGGANTDGCTTVTADVDAEPHLQLRLAAGPGTIATGGATAELTADVSRNSDAAATGAAFPDGTSVAFATDRGSVSPGTAPTGAATAGATLTSGSEAGSATTSATLDGQTVTAPVVFAAPAAPTTVTETTTQTTPPTTVTQTVTETSPPTTVTVPAPPPTVEPTPTPTAAPSPAPTAPPTGAELLAAARRAIGRKVYRLTPSLSPGVAYVDKAVRTGKGTLTVPDEDIVSLLVLACPERPCDAGVSAKVERTSRAGRKLAPYALRRATFSLQAGRQRVVAVRLTRAQRQGVRRARTATMVVVAAVSGPGGERTKRTLRLRLRIRTTPAR